MKEFKDASEENTFSEIFQCAKRAMILQNSNVDEERIFSAMTYIKSKIINCMQADVLNAINVIKFELIREGKCCMLYKLPDSVVKSIGTSKAYMCSTVI